MTQGSEKDYIKANSGIKLSLSAASTGLTVGEALLALLAFILLVSFPHAI
jgi:tetrahydromethanopterin S-methyltransferase subunit B